MNKDDKRVDKTPFERWLDTPKGSGWIGTFFLFVILLCGETVEPPFVHLGWIILGFITLLFVVLSLIFPREDPKPLLTATFSGTTAGVFIALTAMRPFGYWWPKLAVYHLTSSATLDTMIFIVGGVLTYWLTFNLASKHIKDKKIAGDFKWTVTARAWFITILMVRVGHIIREILNKS